MECLQVFAIYNLINIMLWQNAGNPLGGNAGAVLGELTAAIGPNSLIPRTAPSCKQNRKRNNERLGTNIRESKELAARILKLT